MTLSAANLSLPSRLRKIAEQLRGDVLRRITAKAQKAALLWWRDRETPPGVAARFTAAGERYYGFGGRSGKVTRIRPFYHVSGALKSAVLRRKPQTSYRGGVVTTNLSIDGGALNFLSRVQPVRGVQVVVGRRQETYAVLPHTRRVNGRSVPVRGYDVTRVRLIRRKSYRRGGPSMRQEFAPKLIDLRAVEARYRAEWGRFVRSLALTKTGQIRSHLLRGAE